MNNYPKNWGIYIVTFLVTAMFIIATEANLFATDPGLLVGTSKPGHHDEGAFFNVLYRMYSEVMAGNLSGILNITFVNYGFPYFFLQLLLVAPLLAAEEYSSVVFIMREFNLFWFAATVFISSWWVYHRTNDNLLTLLTALVILSQPGLWKLAMYAHPDHMMTFFLVASFVFVDLFPRKNNKVFYVLGAVLFALALSSKTQALIFAPGLAVFLIWDCFVRNSQVADGHWSWLKPLPEWQWRSSFSRLLVFGGLVIAIYLILNPYMLTPQGVKQFIGMTLQNVQSNATNHGSYIIPSLADKLRMIGSQYLSVYLWLIMLIVPVVALGYFGKVNKRVIIGLFIGVIPVFVYLLFFVNKTWSHYYVTPFVFLPVMFFMAMAGVGVGKHRVYYRYLIVSFAVLCIVLSGDGLIKTISRAAVSDREALVNSISLENALNKIGVNPIEHVIFISEGTALRPQMIGYPHTGIRTLWGGLHGGHAKRASVLIIRKDDDYFDDELLKKDNPKAKKYLKARNFIDDVISGRHNRFVLCGQTPVVYVLCKGERQGRAEP